MLPGICRLFGPFQEDARSDPDSMVVFLGVVEIFNMGGPELSALDDAFEPLGAGVVV
jgi:hypothetical protein